MGRGRRRKGGREVVEAEGGMRVGARESTTKQKGMSLIGTFVYL
jgi:hypothetical protein